MSAPYDLILMDIRMPGLGGLASASEIRNGGGPNDAVPIIAFTADADTGETPAGWIGVFDDRVAKPIVPHQLNGVLGRWSPVAANSPALGLAHVQR